jgi:hypothetical protein
MLLRGPVQYAFLSFAAGILLLAPQRAAAASTDGLFMGTQPTSGEHEAPIYDSAYAAEMRLHGGFGNTPESDARPGEYYFVLGAQAFRKHEYEFAVQMYQVAASWAFKPAEYNLAVMYARGQGVAVDLPRAMVWAALAAERNESRYVGAREAVYAELTADQFAQANAIWRELKTTYGDDIALRRAKARWAEVRSKTTGSRVGAVGHLEVSSPSPNSGDASSQKLVGAIAKVAKVLGVRVVNSTASSPAEVTGGEGVDGSIAYRRLRESDNPYDPKFETSALGKATVGPLTEIKSDAAQPAPQEKKDAEKHDAEKHDR